MQRGVSLIYICINDKYYHKTENYNFHERGFGTLAEHMTKIEYMLAFIFSKIKSFGLKTATMLQLPGFNVWIIYVCAADFCRNVTVRDDRETFRITSHTFFLHMQDHCSSIDYLPLKKKNKHRSNFISQWPYSSVFTCEKSTASFVWFSYNKNTMSILYCTVLPTFPIVYLHYFSEG